MKCPKCAAPLIVLEAALVELDHCTSCGGVWLDAGELEILLDEASNRDTLMASLKSHGVAKEKSIQCPICFKILDKVLYGEKVLLDMCPRSHGLWFDGGELQEVMNLGDFPEERRVYEIINNIFGKANGVND